MDAVRFGLDIQQRKDLGFSFLIETCWVILREMKLIGGFAFWNERTQQFGPRKEATQYSDQQHNQLGWQYARTQGGGWRNEETL